MDRKQINRLLLVALLLGLVAAFFGLGLQDVLTLEKLRASHQALVDWRQQSPITAALLYLVIYTMATGLLIPGAAVLTLAGGAIFGLGLGTLLTSFASSLGALLGFLVARYLLHDVVKRRFGRQLEPIEQGFKRDGVLYLLSLRLVPVFPFFVINILMALTPMRAATFYLTSQLGMLPGTLVYVNAGTQLAKLRGLDGILSPPIILSLLLLAVFPWIAKAAIGRWQTWRLYRRWRKPHRFDRNLIVIGAGAAGLVTSYIAATVKARVTLIEAGEMGGDCLNTGCVPSKALITTARLAARMRQADRYGLAPVEPKLSIRQVLERVEGKVKAIAPHDSIDRYEQLGVEVLQGHAKLTDPWTVSIRHHDASTQQLTARAIVLATGASPWIPDLPGRDQIKLLTSETIWSYLRHCPVDNPILVVLGGGPIACELAQAMAQLGLSVTQVQRGNRLLRKEDPEVAAMVREALVADGVQLLTNCKVCGFGQGQVLVEHEGEQKQLRCDAVLSALGRHARLQGYGLEELGISTGTTINTDDYLRTNYPNILAAGDVAGPYQFTHTAAHQAWYAAVNALFGSFRAFKADYKVIPRVTFTDPEVAVVGITESEAVQQGIAFEVTRFPLDELDRAIVESAERGFVKILTPVGKDKILGVTVVGQHAGELLAEFVLAMKWNLGLNKILGTIHAYPTFSEASKYASGAWKKSHSPQLALKLLQRFHKWRRRA
ncbi:MAG: pyridine nucleotide-disulfide oxidoreductase [Aphanocapsa feldmannii 277cV]|uniref:Pyridine nucleotide-disulfide oxidoreductase n=1 Tax=Aphanocapsa feldmannii 277cV TaxID=2507553 RepID=A0A524RPD0_9CHRO|nr:MAG: pyridine nucleotide-disulfide oxidoreductase [Aphanocapsa feldmannii 277cV]